MSTPSDEHPLPDTDIRAIVRLIGEVAAAPGGHAEKKRLLMDGLCRLIDADQWAWALCARMSGGESLVYVNVTHGGFTRDQFGRYLRAVDHPQSGELMTRFFTEFTERKTHLTRTLLQIDPEERMRKMEVQKLFEAADVDPLMLSYRPIDENSISGIGVYRRVGRPAFSPREARIAHIVLTEVTWLHQAGWPDDRGSEITLARELSRQQRTTLNLLIDGMSRKQIAAVMHLSAHTVNSYVKVIYKHFGVNSQSQLLSRLAHGDGGDKA